MSGDLPVPPVIRQQELINEIGALLPERVEGPWTTLILNRRALSTYGQHDLHVRRPDGTLDRSQAAPRRVSKLVKELRKLMYQPGGGCWYSAQWTVMDNGDGSLDVRATFDYDDEPEWYEPIDPALYGLDLEDYPRDPENIPAWLRERLDEARANAHAS
ncbi:agglutinin cell wall attachment protein [Nocardioides sp. NPDC057772]|uniref:hypothetical protein n=1 Tax=Nocardioides sp. NPDC057772 TaxID=3346245 RepID=UPI0002028C8F|nr:hypothetical protein NBCG_02957 [Nocardioidaceae bacterium Broad-1]